MSIKQNILLRTKKFFFFEALTLISYQDIRAGSSLCTKIFLHISNINALNVRGLFCFWNSCYKHIYSYLFKKGPVVDTFLDFDNKKWFHILVYLKERLHSFYRILMLTVLHGSTVTSYISFLFTILQQRSTAIESEV